ncbi:MAG TPA: hypothetical protein VJU86_21705 [Pyrinomonadaceae bacterium]|nr:hypothetical protein [Pyrinomonadaceae bacterium]
MPDINFKALVADSREAFWNVRKVQINSRTAALEGLISGKLDQLTPEETVWGPLYAPDLENQRFARVALKFFDPVRGFFRDLVSSTLPTVSALVVMIVGYVVLLNMHARPSSWLPFALGVLALGAAVMITASFFGGERGNNLTRMLENSTGSLVGGLVIAALVIGLFSFYVHQRTEVKSKSAQVQQMEDQVELSVTLESVIPVAKNILANRPPEVSLEEAVDTGIRNASFFQEEKPKKVSTTPKKVVYEIASTSEPIYLTFTSDNIDIKRGYNDGYRIMTASYEGSNDESVRFKWHDSEIKQGSIDLKLLEPRESYSINGLNSLKGSNLLVTYDLNSMVLVGMQKTTKSDLPFIYYNPPLAAKLQQVTEANAAKASTIAP